jgi:hypothetical protein
MLSDIRNPYVPNTSVERLIVSVERLIVEHGLPASSPATKAAPRIGKRALTPHN